jgi:hypothetical protein
MTTAKQRAANRHNAHKSTGPKTAEGKAVVSLNAMKHGLLSHHVLLPDEDEAELVELGKRLRAYLHPVGELEVLLVDRIVTAAWRLRRLLIVEQYLFHERRTEEDDRKPVNLGLAFIRDLRDKFSKLARYETTIERSLYKALHELQRLQAVRAGAPVPPPVAADVDVNVTVQSGGEDAS